MKETAQEWSLRTWKERHDAGYFPNSEQHKDWKVYPSIPKWLDTPRFVRADTVALEIGCGYGEWMIPLSKMVKSVDGIDIHQTPLDKANELFAQHSVTNARVQQNDGLTVPFADEMYSLVYSISVFQHLPRSIVKGYLKESVRVAQKGGDILHLFRNADNVGDYPELAKDIEANHTGDFSVGWTAGEIRKAVAEIPEFEFWEILDLGLTLILVGRRAR